MGKLSTLHQSTLKEDDENEQGYWALDTFTSWIGYDVSQGKGTRLEWND